MCNTAFLHTKKRKPFFGQANAITSSSSATISTKRFFDNFFFLFLYMRWQIDISGVAKQLSDKRFLTKGFGLYNWTENRIGWVAQFKDRFKSSFRTSLTVGCYSWVPLTLLMYNSIALASLLKILWNRLALAKLLYRANSPILSHLKTAFFFN